MNEKETAALEEIAKWAREVFSQSHLTMGGAGEGLRKALFELDEARGNTDTRDAMTEWDTIKKRANRNVRKR